MSMINEYAISNDINRALEIVKALQIERITCIDFDSSGVVQVTNPVRLWGLNSEIARLRVIAAHP